MEIGIHLLSLIIALVTAPLLFGVINKTKAFFAGRRGAPLFQAYYDLFKLLRKDWIVTSHATWITHVAPIVIFASTLAATWFVPLFASRVSFTFTGDFVLLFYLLGLARFFLILYALDTASAFEGMGASREAFLSALAEPTVFIVILTILRLDHTTSIQTALALNADKNWVITSLAVIPLFIIMLAENARIPFDDPNTHLELTMIHEVMILDASGPALAVFEYASALKLWLFSLIIAKMIIPSIGGGVVCELIETAGIMVILSVIIGCVESVMARCRFAKIPQLMYSAMVIALIAFYLSVSNILTNMVAG